MQNDELSKALAVIPVIIMMTLADVLIASTISISAFLQLTLVYGISKGISLGVAVLVAMAVMAYIRFQPNMRRYIDTRSHKI